MGELPRPAVAGIIAVAVLLVGAIGFFVMRSGGSTTPSASEEQQRQQTITEQYEKRKREGKDLEPNPMPLKTDTSCGGPGGIK